MHSSQQTHRPTPRRRFRVKRHGHARPGAMARPGPLMAEPRVRSDVRPSQLG
jgi:hypothetical protein